MSQFQFDNDESLADVYDFAENEVIPFIVINKSSITLTKQAKSMLSSLDSQDIKIVSMIGKSLSGKSTLLNLILSLDSSTVGSPWKREKSSTKISTENFDRTKELVSYVIIF